MQNFNYEDLEVWKKAIEFARRVINLTEHIDTGRKHYRLIEQLESASASIAINIAEGKGRYSKKEFIQFLCISKGSLFETVSLLEIFCLSNWINKDQLLEMKQLAGEIGKMLSGLISSIRASIN